MSIKETEKVQELKERLSIRNGLREKVLYFYGIDIYEILETAAELDFRIIDKDQIWPLLTIL